MLGSKSTALSFPCFSPLLRDFPRRLPVFFPPPSSCPSQNCPSNLNRLFPKTSSFALFVTSSLLKNLVISCCQKKPNLYFLCSFQDPPFLCPTGLSNPILNSRPLCIHMVTPLQPSRVLPASFRMTGSFLNSYSLSAGPWGARGRIRSLPSGRSDRF